MKIFDVIKYEGGNDVLVWKFPGEDFNTLSQLIVHETQEAVFFKDGQALDIFPAGRYTLHSQNIPLIRRIVNLPFNGVSPFHCEVYFVNKAVSMDVYWGTANPIPIQDAKYQIILPISSHGQFGVRVSDSKKLLLTLVGTTDIFDQGTLKKYFKGILLTNIKDYISTQLVKEQISFLEIQSHLRNISDKIGYMLSSEFEKYGIELVNFTVNDIAPPDDDESFIQLKNALAKKAEMSVMGYNYQQERTFDMLDRAVSNPGSGASIMNAGMGLGMGINMGGFMGTTMGNSINNVGQSIRDDGDKNNLKCKKCGASVPVSSKFCLQCGEKIDEERKQIIVCPKCGEEVPSGKFCLSCGYKFETKCSSCEAELVLGAKFCLQCGERIV